MLHIMPKITPDESVERIREALRTGKTTIRGMSFEEREVAENVGIIDKRDISFAFWDGSFPPPAAIRCGGTNQETLGPNLERWSACTRLEGHKGKCIFEYGDDPSGAQQREEK